MFDEGRDNRTIQRGIDEAYACQDMLPRATPKPSLLSRALGRVLEAASSLARRALTRERPVPPVIPSVRVEH